MDVRGLSLKDLPLDAISHIALWLLRTNDFLSAQHLAWTCKEMNQDLEGLRAMAKMRRHQFRWAVERLDDDVIVRCRAIRAFGTDGAWRRAYGRPLLPKYGYAQWAIRIDRSRSNQGFMLVGVSLQQRTGLCEWCLCPFYGRVFRRMWDDEANLLCGQPPPAGYPDGHLKNVLIDEESGEPTNLEGRARGCVIEVTLDHEEGTLSFRLNGGPDGPKICGFPVGDSGGMLLRPVLGFRAGSSLTDDDRVTLRAPERLRHGWPQLDEGGTRERDLRGVIAARSLAGGGARGGALGDASSASGASSNRIAMRLASFRQLVHSPHGGE